MDLSRGAGPLAGLQAALGWAAEREAAGVFLLGCDMPLVPPELVRSIAARFDGVTAVAPASRGPLGLEPLCACYPVTVLAEVARRLVRGHRAMGDLVADIGLLVVAEDEVRAVADPEVAFLNVNTPADRERAEALLGEGRDFAGGRRAPARPEDAG